MSKQQQPQFNPDMYCVVYEEVLHKKEARKIFHEFLMENRNEEPILFLDSLVDYCNMYEHVLEEIFGGWIDDDKTILKNSSLSSKLHKTKFRNEIIERVATIISNFIEFNSEKELNIGTEQSILLKEWKQVDDELIDTFDSLTGGSSSRVSFSVSSDDSYVHMTIAQLESAIMKRLDPETFFSNVSSVVHLDLKMDQFPRFVRSEKLRNFLISKGESFTRSIGYDISKGYKVDLRFQPKDLKEQVITDNHIYFGFTLAQDTPDWKLISNRKDLHCYSSNTTYFFGESKGMKLLKAVMYLPFSLEDVMKVVYNSDNHDSFDPQTKGGFVLEDYRPPSGLNLEKEGKSSYATQCLSISVDLSIPFIKKRHLASVATTISDMDLYFHVLHTADFTESQMSKSKSKIKADSLSYYLFYRVSNQLTRIVHITYSDFQLPFQTDLLISRFWKKRAKILMKGILDTLNKTKLSETQFNHIEKFLTDSHKHRQAVEDNKIVFPNRSWYKEWLELNEKSFEI